MLILKNFVARRNGDDTADFPRKEESWLYGTLSKRRNDSKIWTFFRKEEQVENMDYPRK